MIRAGIERIALQGRVWLEGYLKMQTRSVDETEAEVKTGFLHLYVKRISSVTSLWYRDDSNTEYKVGALNSSSRSTNGIDTTDDLIVDSTTRGLVIKDTQSTPHYWRLTITTVGALVTTDLGTTKP